MIVRWIGLVLLIAVLGFAYSYRGLIRAALAQPQLFSDPVLDEVAPDLPRDLGAVPILSFSKTNGYRHHEAIAASRVLLDELAGQQGWQFYHSENAAVFSAENLARFHLVVLNHKSGTVWTEGQRNALRTYVESGGNIVAWHAAAGDTSYDWDWYIDEVLRAQFVDHPMQAHIQGATLNVENNRHPATQHLPSRWQREDEWYNFAASPRSRVNVLVSIDETSYDPEKSPMGRDHPMVWWHSVGAGKIFYSAMGHTAASYQEPEFQAFIVGAINWGLDPKVSF